MINLEVKHVNYYLKVDINNIWKQLNKRGLETIMKYGDQMKKDLDEDLRIFTINCLHKYKLRVSYPIKLSMIKLTITKEMDDAQKKGYTIYTFDEIFTELLVYFLNGSS